MNINPVLRDMGNYPVATIQQRAIDRREAGLPIIDFSIGDPREPTPKFIREAMHSAIPQISQYPTAAGRAELRAAVAGWVKRRFGVTVDPATQVVPTSGSKEAIFNSPLAFVDRDAGDVVVFPSPGYPVYERGAIFAGAQIHRVVLDGDFVMRASLIPSDVFDEAKIVWSCSPHNPTGAVTNTDDLAALYRACREHGAWLLSDECYADTYEEEVFPDGPTSVLEVADDGLEGVLAYFSLSKRSGMTGYRSGVIVGDPVAIKALKELRSTTGTASPDFVQAAAVAAWSDDEHAAARRAIFTAKRRILERAFLDLGMDVVASRAGLYLWVKVGDDLAVTDKLLDQGVVVSPGRFFGTGGEGYIRLALVPALEECEQAAEALIEALK
ncbi:MAG: aminotransferase class I/II-fold pyridoxal phosphate-dependent enzyme [Acidimicrobiia bacterium]|nr:aminotransferase class I/II-fold pyridoxal phosphate-dependent enzyme [Acidimicrobiia bacterium]